MKREVVDVIKEIFRSCLSDCPADISNLAITQLAKLLEFLQLDSEKQMYLNLVRTLLLFLFVFHPSKIIFIFSFEFGILIMKSI